MENEEHIKKEFARAFGWFEKRGQYDNYSDPKPRVPTWEEVFVELGKLLRSKDYNMLDQRIDLIHGELESMKPIVFSEKP